MRSKNNFYSGFCIYMGDKCTIFNTPHILSYKKDFFLYIISRLDGVLEYHSTNCCIIQKFLKSMTYTLLCHHSACMARGSFFFFNFTMIHHSWVEKLINHITIIYIYVLYVGGERGFIRWKKNVLDSTWN